jgi:FkbM family methyltransferase
MELADKRKKLLETFEMAYYKVQKFLKTSGPGLFLKLKRLLVFRKQYLIYGLSKILKRNLKAALFFGKEILLPAYDFDALSYFFAGCLRPEEYELTKFLIKNLKEKDIFYDVGAHYGFYTLLANEIIQEGEIHAFEPNPLIFNFLKNNVPKKKNIFLNNCALSEANKEISFFQSKKTSGASTIIESVSNYGLYQFADYTRIAVPAITLDDYVKSGHNPPTIMKIDVEGAESLVLKGAKNTLVQNNPILIVEIWGGKRYTLFSQKTINELLNLGYKKIFKINKEGSSEKIDKIDLIEFLKKNADGSWYNFIFQK